MVHGGDGDGLAGAHPLGVVGETAREVVVAAQHMGDAYGGVREGGVRREDRLGLTLALAVVAVEELRVVPGEVEVDGDRTRVEGVLAHRRGGVLVLVHLDRRRHQIPPGAAGEDAAGDRRLARGVADLVDDDVEGARAQRAFQGSLLIAVGDEMNGAGRRCRRTAVDDGDAVSGGHQPGDEPLPEIPVPANDAHFTHSTPPKESGRRNEPAKRAAESGRRNRP
uniref:Uncharacterized protein n=1 Tax=Streptomyces avermitilis TaxID=33903 RepID=A0A499VCP6_STRAX|nr:hypothetical protein SAVMC3_32590 [Streptomyces avermitilis]